MTPLRPTPLRIGLLGAADITARALIEPARRAGHRVVVVAARDLDRATVFAQTHGIERVATSYADVINDPEVDLIYNPLANSLHAPWNIHALQAGKNVLSEKPSAANAQEARLVAEVARASKGFVMEAYHYAFHPVMKRVLEIVESGEIGEVRHVDSVMMVPAPVADNPRWSLALAGGAQMDLGCYSLHAMRLIGALTSGPPTVTSAAARERAGRPGVDEWLRTEVGFPSGATGRAIADMAGDESDGPDFEMSLTVNGLLGRIRVPNFVLPQLDDRIEVMTHGGLRTENLGTRPTYDYQLEVIAEASADGSSPPLDLDDAIETMELIDASYAAAGLEPRPGFVSGGAEG